MRRSIPGRANPENIDRFMKIVVYCGSMPGSDPAYIKMAAELGTRIAREGHTLVYGGGSTGMMGAVADAALAGGAHVTGVTPAFMFERDWTHKALSELIITKDMHERKRHMMDLGDVFVALPGGTGTLEEILEAVSWMGLGLIKGVCFFVNTNGYYDHIKEFFEEMSEKGYVRDDNVAGVVFVQTLDELFSETGRF